MGHIVTTSVVASRFIPSFDQIDEFMNKMATPEGTAIDAAFSFFEAGGRPADVNWEPLDSPAFWRRSTRRPALDDSGDVFEPRLVP